jgi:WD40 repeat protein
MSYCLNPACQQPQNSGDAIVCQTCGAGLLLGERFRALQLIGQGGFGRTFLAVDEAEPAKPLCVIKQLLPRDPGVAQQAATLFQQEAERLAELGQHPQIPELLARYELDNAQYLVQEFIDGANLETVLAEDGPFREAQIRDLLADLLPVLRFIHSYQVIHRDIKPANLIRPYGGDRLVLVDFGASKYATGTALARTGTVIGSAGYVAPEQAMGKADFASDLYSLGVTCIHLLTGMHPFDLYSVGEDTWIWRDYLPRSISGQLRRVLDKLLQRATSQRYRSATEVLQALQLEPGPVQERRYERVASVAYDVESSTKRTRYVAPAVDVIPAWRTVQVLTGHDGMVTAIAISPDGQTLASASVDRSIKLWDLDTGHLLHTFSGRSLWSGTGHSDRVNALTFSPDSQIVISASDDGTIKQWDITTQKLISTLPGYGWVISAIAASQDGHTLTSAGGDGVIQIWDLETDELITSLMQHRDRVSGLLISPDGQTLISSSYDRTIRLWNLNNDLLLNTLKAHADRVSAIAVSPDWRTLVSGSWDKTLKIWDLAYGAQLKVIAAHRDRISCVAIHPDGDWIASGSEDSSIKLWDLETGDRLQTLRHAWGVTAIAFTSDGELLVSASADETIKIWQQD